MYIMSPKVSTVPIARDVKKQNNLRIPTLETKLEKWNRLVQVYSLTYFLLKKHEHRMFHFIFVLFFFLFELKTSPYERAPIRAETFDPTDDEEDSSITSFEKGSPAKQ